MIIKPQQEAKSYQFTTENGHTSWVTNYFGTEPVMDRALPRPQLDVHYPQAFIVALEPNYTLDPHFHVANQFQLFISGSGVMARKECKPYSVHYANAYTPYGPIVAGKDGLSYITIRNGWDDGPRYMPKHRDALRTANREKRHLDPANIRLVGEEHVSTIFEISDDGLGGWVYRVAPGASATGPDPRTGGGQCWVVGSGVLELDGKSLPPLSCVFVNPDEEALTFSAASQAQVIALQFPQWPRTD